MLLAEAECLDTQLPGAATKVSKDFSEGSDAAALL
jgi:hypothetical protein